VKKNNPFIIAYTWISLVYVIHMLKALKEKELCNSCEILISRL